MAISALVTKDLIEGLLGPISELVDELHVSVEEKAELKNKIYAKAIELTEKSLDYEKELFSSQAKVILAEATGQSWIQRNWRPLTMLAFVAMFIWNWTGGAWTGTMVNFPEWVGTAFTVGLGGYVAGRSAEKIASTVSLNRDLLKMPGEGQRDLKAWRKLLKSAKTDEERERILELISEATG